MKFRSGMLGVTVVMVAIAGALLGAWALSTDVNSTTITVYNELTEITPLFGSEPVPQYSNYNPSTNYTGYYTDNSVIDDVRYFDGVDYTSSVRANTYRLSLPPTSSITDTQSLAGITPDANLNLSIWYWPSNNSQQHIQNVNGLTVADLITAMGLGSYTKIKMYNTTDPDFVTTESFVVFEPLSEMSGSSASRLMYMKNPSLTGDLDRGLGMTRPASETSDPIVAMSYDATTGFVSLYYDNDMTVKAGGLYSPDQVYILWGGSSGILYNFIFGDSFDYEALQLPQVTYMDPSKGVSLT